MCLILVSYKYHNDFPLVIASNRDEFHNRPTAPMAWQENGDILCGIDLKEGGTWLGLSKTGRFAALTNYRDPANIKANAPSRGHLVTRFLQGRDTPEAFVEALRKDAKTSPCNGYNLLFGWVDALYHYSNISDELTPLPPGVHAVSNALLNTPWPKTQKGRQRLAALDDPTHENLFKILSDTHQPDDDTLPDTGMGLEWERILSPLFIANPVYGTRSSCVITRGTSDEIKVSEKSYAGHGKGPDEITGALTFSITDA